VRRLSRSCAARQPPHPKAPLGTAFARIIHWFHFRPGSGGDITNIDLGYRLRRSSWNKGYATEGSRALISMGFTDLAVGRVFAHTMTVNTASRTSWRNAA
jgi:RimJ/RimL family protein N-acetyltransferase